ncbi:MAG: hypothetical protein HGN29_02535 [Asgard group archaeon]|nr:hypothetical protein [Asgard group archaeon]
MVGWGAIVYMWGGYVGITPLLFGSIMLAIAFGLVFVWLFYPTKLFRKKLDSEN